jgi:xylulokinase
LGVDSSTQSCKVEIRDLNTGRLLGTGSAVHPPAFPPSSEQHPADWVTAFVSAARQAISRCAEPPDVRAISVAAQCHGLVLLDEHGDALRAAKLWNDTTGSPNLARLVERIGARRWVMRIGSLPTAAFTIAKLAWVAENEPGLLDRIATVLLPHDYLTYWLTGEKVTDRSDASGTGYFDAVDGQWIPSYLDLVRADQDWSTKLPTVLGPADAAGTVRPARAAELGIRDDVVVGAGGGDQHAAYLGLGLTDGDQYFSIGTSGVVATSSRGPVFDTTGAVDGVADMTGGYLPLMSRRQGGRPARHRPRGHLGAGTGGGTHPGPGAGAVPRRGTHARSSRRPRRLRRPHLTNDPRGSGALLRRGSTALTLVGTRQPDGVRRRTRRRCNGRRRGSPVSGDAATAGGSAR